MPSASISNHAIYLIAREQYLKGLLEAGILSQTQFEQMDRYLCHRLRVDEASLYSQAVQTKRSPVQTGQASGLMNIESPADIPPHETTKGGGTSEPTIPAIATPPQKAKTVAFVSLTDIAREYNHQSPGYVIQSWMRDPNTLELLHLWELENNPAYNEGGYHELKSGTITSSMTPKRWIEKTGAVGMISKQGQKGGTYAHPVIAGDLLTWLSPRFKLMLLQFQKGLTDDAQPEAMQ